MDVYKSLPFTPSLLPVLAVGPVVMKDNVVLAQGLVCCWGESGDFAKAHSKLLLLSPEHSGSGAHDCQTRSSAKQRQDTTRHTKAKIFLFL